MQFWNKEDLLLTKKIEHYGKKCNWKNVENTCPQIFKEKFEKVKEYMEERVKIIERDGNQSLKQRNATIKREKKMLLDEFVTENIVPRLLAQGYFDNYKIPMKKDSLDRDIGQFYLFSDY